MDEVVNALTDISEGNTCDIGTGDYTPALSDSSYTSEPEFDENEDENGTFEDE
ncbi:cysteine-rich receptor-like protein, partial [Trifolium medium]|nr:cysteine-rich receptor-like protein [Trifolium medium]